MLLVRAGRVVAHRGDPRRDLVPRLREVAHRLVEDDLVAQAHPRAAVVQRSADHPEHAAEPVRGEHGLHLGEPRSRNLEHGTQLLGEQTRQRGHLDLDAARTSERHLGDRRPQATVRTVVVGENRCTGTEVVHRSHEVEESLRIVEIRHRAAEDAGHLGDHGAAQAVPASPEVDEHEHRLAKVRPGRRRHRAHPAAPASGSP